jgi:antitoxin (DNA-binding transcriptional repressor) of toxin-antitoxin stability system
LGNVKTITTREFFHTPALVRTLRPGQALIVTDKGAPSFTVTKAGARRLKSRQDLEREALEICPEAKQKVNFAEAIRDLKRR